MSNDPIDVHTQTAMKLFKVAHASEVTKAQRDYAKSWNYIELYSQNVPLPQRTQHVLYIAGVDLATAEALLAAFEARGLAASFKALTEHYKDLAANSTAARSSLEECLEAMKRKAPPEYPKREKLRFSSKTGKSWPKPRGSY